MAAGQAQHVVLIVGGAIAGSEAAAQFTARGVLCIVVDQNARPYGKIEDGLPRWHVKLRESEEDKIDAKLARPNVLFVPRTRLGRDLTLDEVRTWGLSAVVLANGAWRDRSLPIPHADAYVGRGLAYQNAFVMWFNHYAEPGYDGPQYEVPDGALVVGGGLASLDVVKILQLETVVRALAARGIQADLYGMERRGVKKVLDEHGLSLEALGLTGCTLVYRRRVEDMPLAEPPEGATPEQAERTRATRRKLLTNFREKYLFNFRDLLSPLRAVAEGGRLAGLRFQRTELRNGSLVLIPGEEVELRAPLVISSIGSIPESVDGVQMRGELYPVKDPETGELEDLPGVFAIGNAVTGKGNILVSLKHGRRVSQRMLESYLLGEGSGYEEVLAGTAATAGAKMAAVAERLRAAPLLPPDQVDAIVQKVRALQARAGYPGDYRDWIAKVRPARPPNRRPSSEHSPSPATSRTANPRDLGPRGWRHPDQWSVTTKGRVVSVIEDSTPGIESAKGDPRPPENESLTGEASAPPSPEVPAAAAADRWVKVWDLPTRVFHWMLVFLVAVNAFTGFVTPEWWLGVHNWAGYGLVALMIFRLVWGICGSEYSRVVSFIYPPRDTIEHLRGLLLLRPPHYVGHNPTGALMVFALAGLLIALVVTGLLVLGGEEKQGPLSGVIGYSVGFAAKQVHHWLTILLLVMVLGHIAGVVTESVLTHDNLVRAITTGWKKLPPAAPVPTPRATRPLLAVALLVVLAGAAVATLAWLSRRPPPLSLRALPENATYKKECGACHYALNPSLLPASSWAALMTSLREHFGEDASLDGPTTRRLAAWLVGNAAETFDTESASRFRMVAPDDPYRVSSTPYWVRKHASVSPDVFVRKSVRSKVNCHACHRDAESGRYDDQAIAIPKE